MLYLQTLFTVPALLYSTLAAPIFAEPTPNQLFNLNAIVHRTNGESGTHPVSLPIIIQNVTDSYHVFIVNDQSGSAPQDAVLNYTLSNSGELKDSLGKFLTVDNETGILHEALNGEIPSNNFTFISDYLFYGDAVWRGCPYGDESGLYNVIVSYLYDCPGGAISEYDPFELQWVLSN